MISKYLNACVFFLSSSLILLISTTNIRAAVLTFDHGSVINGVYLENGISVTGSLQLGDASGDGSNDLTRVPGNGPITFLPAAPYNFISFDLLTTPITTGGFNRMFFYYPGSSSAAQLIFGSYSSTPIYNISLSFDSRGYNKLVWDYDYLNPPNGITTIDNLTFSWITDQQEVPPAEEVVNTISEPASPYLLLAGLVALVPVIRTKKSTWHLVANR